MLLSVKLFASFIGLLASFNLSGRKVETGAQSPEPNTKNQTSSNNPAPHLALWRSKNHDDKLSAAPCDTSDAVFLVLR